MAKKNKRKRHGSGKAAGSPQKGTLYSYILERLRIHRTLMLARKERIHDDLRLLDKRERQADFLRRKMSVLYASVSRDMQRLERKVRSMHSQKSSEQEQLQRYRKMIGLLKAIEEKTKKVYKAEGKTLEKEKGLLNDLEQLLEKHSKELNYHRRKNMMVIEDIVQKKKRLLLQAGRTHHEEESILPADRNVLENMASHQVQLIRGLADELGKLRGSYSIILREKRSLQKQELNFQKQLQHIAVRKKKLKLLLQKMK